MHALVKAATIAAALALSSQPCLAAVVEGQSPSLAATAAVSATDRVDFDLTTHTSADAGQTQAVSLALATAAATAQDAADQHVEERKRQGMSKGAKTALVVGGVVLVGVIVAGIIAMNNLDVGPVMGHGRH